MKIIIHEDFIKTKKCRLAMAKESLAEDRIALAFPKMSPFTQVYNKELVCIAVKSRQLRLSDWNLFPRINWLRQVGLLDRWEMAYSPRPNRCSAELSSSRVKSFERSLTISYFSSPITLLIVGYSSSILAFILELLHSNTVNSKTIQS